jgi:hypothetical protein
MPVGSGATGAACVGADVATKIKPATAIANVVRSMCLSLLDASLVLQFLDAIVRLIEEEVELD